MYYVGDCRKIIRHLQRHDLTASVVSSCLDDGSRTAVMCNKKLGDAGQQEALLDVLMFIVWWTTSCHSQLSLSCD